MSRDPAAVLRAQAAQLRAEADAVMAEAEAKAARLKRAAKALEDAAALTTATNSTHNRSMLPDSPRRTRAGRPRVTSHPFLTALGDTSVAEWALAHGIKRPTVQQWIAGKRPISPQWAALIERELGVPPSAWAKISGQNS